MDDGLGKMTLYNITTSGFENTDIGEVDYTSGKVSLAGFTTDIDDNLVISMYGAPVDTDISSNKNLLVLFDSAVIETTAI
jgi:hypothetical protein